ncbi:unnamed protein product [Rhizophagus irregularis]|nr:unnamed protein product [Rhizophagus irregularis]CAB4432375.1 unnamed protein product [Rhizophagus irregularis]
MQKIVTYWPENQTPPKDLIHVIIETPDLAKQPVSADKRKHEDHIITTEGPLHPHQGSLMLPIHERDIFQVVKSVELWDKFVHLNLIGLFDEIWNKPISVSTFIGTKF